jgi:hypothetical protein
MPTYRERNPADVGIAIVEAFAFMADELSYFQDAVATEAYLGTARLRSSIRRHARLLDYRIHEGASARAWLAFEIDGPGAVRVPAGTPVSTDTLTLVLGQPESVGDALVRRATVFETLEDVVLTAPRNSVELYTWSDDDCCLPRGAIEATLRGTNAELGLERGSPLLLEEVLGPDSGQRADADPTHRQVVRLDRDPVTVVDPLTGDQVLIVHWFEDDALRFPLWLRRYADGPVSIARVNLVLADHGATVRDRLTPLGTWRRGRPELPRLGLTHPVPVSDDDRRRSAAAAAHVDPRQATPSIVLRTPDGESWSARIDLLASAASAREFVVEMEEDGRAHLRFGDGVKGRRPASDTAFEAEYRVGRGTAGNVGAAALKHVLAQEGEPLPAVRRVWNPLPAVGGVDPEPLDRVRLDAPQAFRTQERAVTEGDYAQMAERHPQVQRAAATRRWTGSWYTMYVTIDRTEGRPVDESFAAEIRGFLDRYRLAGYDVEIDAPRFVPLDVVLTVCVEPEHLRSAVKRALLERFSARPGGFFHPDNFTFAQPVLLSQMVAAAMGVPGVSWVDVDDAPPKLNRFRRWGQTTHGELAAGMITMARLEVARLDNDPSAPERGRIDFVMQGGV